MPKLITQWEFGELFTQPAARRTFTVSQLTTSIKGLLEQQVGKVWVTGEITNLRLQSSGHLYFTIKDPAAQLSCVLFRGEARALNRDLLRDGLRVNLNGDVTVYEARGQYQLIVTAVELEGVGALQIAFEKLKQKLLAEGLFAQERKRPLPRFPRRIGIVTSASGAAIRDVLHVLRRRHRGLELIVASCRVQGQGAGEEVACAIRLLNEWSQGAERDPAKQIDLILVTRGGGSLEDLWAFNEEIVARAIFESTIPIVSAVGHEIDFTISDFVADFRAATPSAAAEIITEGFYSVREFIAGADQLLRELARNGLMRWQDRLTALNQRFQRQHPRRWLHEQWQRLDDLQNSLVRSARYGCRAHRAEGEALVQRLRRIKPVDILSRRREDFRRKLQECQDQVRARLRESQHSVATLEGKLRLLSPQNVLERGYSITRDAGTGEVVRSAEEVKIGQILKTRLKEGEITSRVER